MKSLPRYKLTPNIVERDKNLAQSLARFGTAVASFLFRLKEIKKTPARFNGITQK